MRTGKKLSAVVDLKSFCGDELARPYLHKPFSIGKFTFATDGRLMVRVPRQDGVPEHDGPIKNANKPFDKIRESTTFSRPEFAVPSLDDEECLTCEGHGYEHDCPDCSCRCVKCGGTGIAKASITYDGINFDAAYFAKVLAIPGVELSSARDGEPLFFRFDGGVGALMPLSSRRARHLELIPAGRRALKEMK